MMQSTFKNVIAALQAVTGQSTTTIVTEADTDGDFADGADIVQCCSCEIAQKEACNDDLSSDCFGLID